MESEKLRQQICFQAAQLLHSRRESNFTTAKWRAARAITRSYIGRESLPTDMEIRLALQALTSSSVPTENVAFQGVVDDELPASRFKDFVALLEPLDKVRLNRVEHPEGDLLYHSLQVFQLAFDARPWDEEFIIAALLHDVGYGIDPYDALDSTVRATEQIVSARTLWLIQSLPVQHQKAEGTIGARARRRIDQHEDGEELRLLAECDLNGRVPGRLVDSLETVIQTIKNLAMETDDRE